MLKVTDRRWKRMLEERSYHLQEIDHFKVGRLRNGKYRVMQMLQVPPPREGREGVQLECQK